MQTTGKISRRFVNEQSNVVECNQEEKKQSIFVRFYNPTNNCSVWLANFYYACSLKYTKILFDVIAILTRVFHTSLSHISLSVVLLIHPTNDLRTCFESFNKTKKKQKKDNPNFLQSIHYTALGKFCERLLCVALRFLCVGHHCGTFEDTRDCETKMKSVCRRFFHNLLRKNWCSTKY